MRFGILMLMLLGLSDLRAQQMHLPVHIRMLAGVGGDDFEPATALINPAAAIESKTFTITAGIERKFMVEGWSTGFMQLTLPLAKDVVIGRIMTDRANYYGNLEVAFGYAKKMGAKAAIGVGLHYSKLKVEGYDAFTAITTTVGMIFHVSSVLHASVSFENPLRLGKTSSVNERVLASSMMCLTYSPSAKFMLTSSVLQEENSTASVAVSFCYKITADKLWLRFGCSTAPSLLFFGFVLKKGNLRFEGFNSWQQQLGSSPGINLFYQKQLKPV